MRRNREKIMELIILNRKVTRSQLTEELGISKMAVSKIVTRLIDEDLIEEKEITSKINLGRKSKGLVVKDKKFGEILCIYFGLQNIELQVFDVKKELKLREKIEILSLDNIWSVAIREIENIVSKRDIMIISIGMNGIVNSEEGKVLVSTYYHWTDLNIKNILEKKFGITVVLENGVNLIALAQSRENNNLGKEFVILNIENGVGYTICNREYDSKKVRFKNGEIGHAPFDYSADAFVCVCGNKGCLETKLANWRVEEKVFEELKEKYSYDEIIEYSNKNKTYFRNLVLNLTIPLSHAISWINYLINPEKIIITGKITKCEKYFWQELNREIKNNLLNKEKNIHIEKANYDEDIIVKGAFYLGIENLRDSLFIKKLLGGEKNEK